MPLLQFPILQGLDWSCKLTPTWRTLTQRASTGREYAYPLQDSVLWEFQLSYEFLKQDVGTSTPAQTPGAPQYSDLDTLIGFFNQLNGGALPFLFNPGIYFRNPNYNIVTGSLIGTGDGTTTTFQLIRSYGGYAEPVQSVIGTPNIFVAGSPVTSGWAMNSVGQIVFMTPPTSGAAIVADFRYQYFCRFSDDSLDIGDLAYLFHDCQQVKIHQVWL